MSAIVTDWKHSRWWRDQCKTCEAGNQLSWFNTRIKWVLGGCSVMGKM